MTTTMRFAMKLSFVLALLAITILIVSVPTSAAQQVQKPAAAPATAPAPAPQPPPAPAQPPEISRQAQQAYATLAFKAQVQAEVVATLQKELDSTNAEIGRLVQRLTVEGYAISRDKDGQLIYVPVPEEKRKQ